MNTLKIIPLIIALVGLAACGESNAPNGENNTLNLNGCQWYAIGMWEINEENYKSKFHDCGTENGKRLIVVENLLKGVIDQVLIDEYDPRPGEE